MDCTSTSRDRWLRLAFVLAWLAALVPIWVPREPVPAEAWRAYLPARLLAAVFPLAIAGKFWLTLYAAALPASAGAFAARFGRSPWIALLVFPLVWSEPLARGHVAWCMALPPLLFALVALDMVTERRTPLRLAALVLLGLLATGAVTHLGFAGPAAPLAGALAELYRRILVSWWPGRADELCLIALCTTWLLLAATARAPTAEGERPSLRGFVPELCFVAAALGYLLAPAQLAIPIDGSTVPPRLTLPAALFGAALIRGPIAGARRLLMVPALAIALVYPLALCRQFVHHPADFERAAFDSPRSDDSARGLLAASRIR